MTCSRWFLTDFFIAFVCSLICLLLYERCSIRALIHFDWMLLLEVLQSGRMMLNANGVFRMIPDWLLWCKCLFVCLLLYEHQSIYTFLLDIAASSSPAVGWFWMQMACSGWFYWLAPEFHLFAYLFVRCYMSIAALQYSYIFIGYWWTCFSVRMMLNANGVFRMITDWLLCFPLDELLLMSQCCPVATHAPDVTSSSLDAQFHIFTKFFSTSFWPDLSTGVKKCKTAGYNLQYMIKSIFISQ